MPSKLSPIHASRVLHERGVHYFTPALVADLLALERRQAYRLIARMEGEGLASEVERGKYLLLGLEPERILSNPLFIGSQLVAPSYVSYWSALYHHGLAGEVAPTTFVATTKKKRPVSYRAYRFQFVSLRPHKLFGYRRETLDGLPVVVADEAKAIVDSLDLPQYSGSVVDVARALRVALHSSQGSSADARTLIEYANRMQNKTLCSRLGYMLELLGECTDGLAASDSPVKLEPSRPRSGPTVKRWRVVVNVPQRLLATAAAR